ncbi:hypothetical protein KI387_027470 [Taxus chinensis]|uniref:Protein DETOXIFICATION n=1 Tax=Taxus chinensis TaxID=29808 RepID=A0AA38FZ73_TAXCH|nr:hypothetical protein KI387_027470 [Taxus chinensis]
MEEESLRSPLINGEGREVTIYSDLAWRFWKESKSSWRIAGPAIFSSIATNGLNIITQAFVGHIGSLELAAFSMVINVIVGFTSGLLIGMGSAVSTLGGQAYGAKEEHMLGIYMQRSWITLTAFALAILPLYIFTAPLLKLFGQPDDIAELSGRVSLLCIPMHISFVFYDSLSRFLQAQSKNFITAWSSALGAVVNVLLCWLLVSKWNMGLDGALISLNVAWWTPSIIQYVYATCGWCPHSWTGYSMEAFADLWPFFKLSVASGVMLCLEIWYYRVLVLLTGKIKDTEVAVDSLSICLNINTWEMSIPLGFFTSASVRVGNELGAGRPRGAKFAAMVSVISSLVIGIVLLVLILVFRGDLAMVFTSSATVQKAVYALSILLAFTILLNSVQPVFIGVSVGMGRQSFIAYITLACYYIIGVPLGILLGYVFHLEVKGIWLGMIGGTTIQTFALLIVICLTDWDMEVKRAIERVKKPSITVT